MSAAIDATALARQVVAIRSWVLQRWPGCRPLAEIPLFAKLANGQRLAGRIDLLLLTEDGIVILDHKSTPTGPSQWGELAQTYAGQLAAYAAGVEQVTNRKVLETWLVLPVAGAIQDPKTQRRLRRSAHAGMGTWFRKRTPCPPLRHRCRRGPGRVLVDRGRSIHPLPWGNGFQVARGTMHSEKYGPQGAVYWAARKN